MNTTTLSIILAVLSTTAILATPAGSAQKVNASKAAAGANGGTNPVRITPIGQPTGEYCARDRALLFEDPTGVNSPHVDRRFDDLLGARLLACHRLAHGLRPRDNELGVREKAD